ncbi:hypothetical protein OHPBIL_OHPBIL_14145, partial [Dysosmobacter welbionis]
WSATTIWNHSPSRWPAMCTTLPAGLYLTAFSTRLHTACRSSSAFPARVQGAASTKMVMLRASAWGAAWSAALRISWPEESRSPRDARSRLVSSKSSLTMADKRSTSPSTIRSSSSVAWGRKSCFL